MAKDKTSGITVEPIIPDNLMHLKGSFMGPEGQFRAQLPRQQQDMYSGTDSAGLAPNKRTQAHRMKEASLKSTFRSHLTIPSPP